MEFQLLIVLAFLLAFTKTSNGTLLDHQSRKINKICFQKLLGAMVLPRLPADVLVKGGWPLIDNRIIGGTSA